MRSDATVERTDDSVLVTYHQKNDSIGLSTDGSSIRPANRMKHTDKFYMPNVTRVDYDFGGKRAFVITSQCTPESATAHSRLHVDRVQAGQSCVE